MNLLRKQYKAQKLRNLKLLNSLMKNLVYIELIILAIEQLKSMHVQEICLMTYFKYLMDFLDKI